MRQRLRVAVISFMVLVGLGVGSGLAQEAAKPAGPATLGRLTPAEQYVLDRVAAGRVADLKEIRRGRSTYPTLLYYHFHKISGWILVPIGLAAIFSQFKCWWHRRLACGAQRFNRR